MSLSRLFSRRLTLHLVLTRYVFHPLRNATVRALTFANSQSVESREASVRALKELIRPFALDQQELFGRLVLRLLQDDDPTVRSIAEEIVEAKFSGGVPLADRPAVEVVLGSVGPASLAYYQEELGAFHLFFCPHFFE